MCWYIGGLITLHCYVFLNFIYVSLYNKKTCEFMVVKVGGLLWFRKPCMKGVSMGSNTKTSKLPS